MEFHMLLIYLTIYALTCAERRARPLALPSGIFPTGRPAGMPNPPCRRRHYSVKP